MCARVCAKAWQYTINEKMILAFQEVDRREVRTDVDK